MPSIENLEPIPRKSKLIVYVLDTSGSMEGEKLAAVKSALKYDLEKINYYQENEADLNYLVQIMTFDSEINWFPSNGPTDAKSIVSQIELIEAGGLTDVGKALTELNAKLNRKNLLKKYESGLFEFPTIVFLADGYSTDNYSNALDEILNNRWYKRARKYGMALGDDADLSMVKAVTNDDARHIEIQDLHEGMIGRANLIAYALQRVSICGSMLPSDADTIDWDQDSSDSSDHIGSAIEFGKNVLLPKGREGVGEQKQSLAGDKKDVESTPLFIMNIDGIEIPLYEGENKILKCQIMRCSPEEALNPAFCITAKESQDYMEISNSFVPVFLYYPLKNRRLKVSVNSALAVQNGASIEKDGNNLIFTGMPGSNSEIIIPLDCWDEYNMWEMDYLMLDENHRIEFRKCDENGVEALLGDDDWGDGEDW